MATSDQATNVGKNSQAGYRATATGQWANANANYGTAYGFGSVANQQYATSVGTGATCTGANGTATGANATAGNNSTSAGYFARATGTNCIQLGSNGTSAVTNSDNNTMKVANANGNYEMMSADGSIPSDRLIHAINKYSTMPTAASTNEGWIVQFTGTTDSTYTHGHLYECVSDGADPATYSWAEVSMGGGGSSYTAGTGIDITNGTIRVTSPTLQNTATGTNSLTILGIATTKSSSINIGYNSRAGGAYSSSCLAVGNDSVSTGNYSVALGIASGATNSGAISIGYVAKANGEYSLAIGELATVSANNAIQINAALIARTNSDANTFKVGNANGNFEIMDANGNLPADRLASTTGLADGNYRLRLTMTNGVPTLSWVAE